MSGRQVFRGEMRGAAVLTAVVIMLISGSAWAVASLTPGTPSPPSPVLAEMAGSGTTAAVAPSQRVAEVPSAQPDPARTSAVVANFNLYGCTESAPSWPSCTQRFSGQWDYINRYRLGIVGLQELEPAPFLLFQSKVNAPASGWAMYPTHPVFVHQQTTAVLWRTDQWRLVDAQEIAIPKYSWRDRSGVHFSDAHDAAVLLESPAGQRLWVMSVHNVSGENPSFASGLAQDESIESTEFARRVDSGVPTVLLGDFNDDSDQAACVVISRTASAHSIWGPVASGRCSNLSSTKGQPFDKIIGSRDVVFAHSGIDWSTQSQRLTDHGIAWADALIG